MPCWAWPPCSALARDTAAKIPVIRVDKFDAVALAARYHDIVSVVLGTTFGMMLANVPAVYLGDRIANRVSLRLVHGIAALVFAVLGVATLLGAGAALGF